MKYRPVNLARRPFVNARPVLRTTIFLWALGGLLLIFNAVRYGQSLVGLEDRKDRLESIESEIAGEEIRLASAQDQLRSLDLGAQNDEARYIQARLEERRFPWSRLFGQLAGILPRDVRLFRISPEGFERDRTRRPSSRRMESAKGPRETWLQIAGAAKSDQALVDLLDALFASPAFADPLLPGESVEADGTIRFQLSTIYFPDAEIGAVDAGPTETGSSMTPGAASDAIATDSGQLPPGSSEAVGIASGSRRSPSTGLSSPGSSPGAQRVVGAEGPGFTGTGPEESAPVTVDRDSQSRSSSVGGRRGG
ncbi:MAG: hypothetical protein K8J08_05885, partial [Thermoanaerobaculia bacterium]|nr:hypothetical protein [Thermoanaerobaculia bacterium]